MATAGADRFVTIDLHNQALLCSELVLANTSENAMSMLLLAQLASEGRSRLQPSAGSTR